MELNDIRLEIEIVWKRFTDGVDTVYINPRGKPADGNGQASAVFFFVNFIMFDITDVGVLRGQRQLAKRQPSLINFNQMNFTLTYVVSASIVIVQEKIGVFAQGSA